MASTPSEPTSAAPTTTTTSDSTATMPPLMYGTAWKKERTADLVYEAIKAGFRGIDTAAMTKHYDEAGTGEGIRRAIREGIISRKDLFVRCPKTLLAWSTLQSYLPSSPDPSRRGKILRLGISNVHSVSLLDVLPGVGVVQNRFRAVERAWDRQIRSWCEAKGARYQGFWTLTGNPSIWDYPAGPAVFVQAIADGAGVSCAEAWYVLMMERGVVVLDGTTDVGGHMRGDLEARGKVAEWRGTEEGKHVWGVCWEKFLRVVDSA
ncbi:NADP-dependent oxidoreductase domain-containing protein [Staphylotrichum tortipilum]|uniref:NADP-dependent oxidoreductase domain-containing protein n=1 Tax=Staphylotrichum tortipilum TaxID=2831512 RepID=A0AAN6MG49_9PEZI|nr:NADP-dependent oxidoreductase domain-containing protein [Staphylotrichum longicolle]